MMTKYSSIELEDDKFGKMGIRICIDHSKTYLGLYHTPTPPLMVENFCFKPWINSGGHILKQGFPYQIKTRQAVTWELSRLGIAGYFFFLFLNSVGVARIFHSARLRV